MSFYLRKDVIDPSDLGGAMYAFKWISKRIQEGAIGTVTPLETNPSEGGRDMVHRSWQELEQKWSGAIKTGAVNSSQIAELNAWIVRFFSSGTSVSGKERQRLLSNLRVERARRQRQGFMLTVNFVDLDKVLKKMVEGDYSYYLQDSERWLSFQRAFIRACVDDVLSADHNRFGLVVVKALGRMKIRKRRGAVFFYPLCGTTRRHGLTKYLM